MSSNRRSTRKRPNIFGEDEPESTSPESATKRMKGEKSQPSFVPPPSSSPSPGPAASPSVPDSQAAKLAAARAAALAKFASFSKDGASSSSSSSAPAGTAAASSSSPALTPLGVRAAPISKPTGDSLGGGGAADKFDASALARQVAEAKRRAMEALGRAERAATTKSSPSSSTPLPAVSQEPRQMGLHPLLMSDSSGPSTPTITGLHNRAPKYSSVKANARSSSRGFTPGANRVNPYLAAMQAERAGTASPAPGEEEGGGPSFSHFPKARSVHRQLQFNKAGRHAEKAEEMRREAQMEELKRRIAESARKAGMEEEMEGSERALKREPPPDVEWWDAALLPSNSYDNLESALISTPNSPITLYVQHPIPIPAPGDKNQVGLKGVMLTKKEMKKMRRQRRLAEQRDKQDRIKMGLLPPDPPKVKLANLMRVLTSEAVADPTKVEARVRREVAARREQHERTNLERQLTDEQKREKRERKMEEDDRKGVQALVFKIKHLGNPSHKFKTFKNAQQFGLTGITIFNPNFVLVFAEGPNKGIKGYKHLMLDRIDWTEEPMAREGDEERGANSTQDAEGDTRPFDWSTNTCELIWEGPLRDRLFKAFRARNCPTDNFAREALGEKLAGYWDVAKKWHGAAD